MNNKVFENNIYDNILRDGAMTKYCGSTVSDPTFPEISDCLNAPSIINNASFPFNASILSSFLSTIKFIFAITPLSLLL